ncbi:BhlA/UviB family holin-like peptide [Gottschalkia purinilytica]|uniref:BhlA/UviB family holin-like peptide n=1 Tax=Gottschalkia purinilytica TaxID=1503 RepID=UPI00067C6685|nr:BhlA/UviB family holin-like peptide [Gottschalkia purinilytica]
MEQQIIKIALSQGIWAVLFVFMLFYVLKENSNRENNYQEIIKELSDKFNIIEDVKEDVREIKKKIFH